MPQTDYSLLDDLLEVVQREGPLERLVPAVARAGQRRRALAQRVQRELLLQRVQAGRQVLQ